MDNKFEQLAKLGSGNIEHVNGSLKEHLVGTYELLKSWGADPILCDAGLYHAAYGTPRFDNGMVPLQQRDSVAKIIGADAEAIVYLYCACDLEFFWPQIGLTSPIMFKDRFTNKTFELNDDQLVSLCELTVANDLEIIKANREYINKHGAELRELFDRMAPFISKFANKEVGNTLYK